MQELLDLQRLVLEKIKEKGEETAAISSWSCNNNSCNGAAPTAALNDTIERILASQEK